MFGMTPGPGRHIMRYQGRWLSITRDRETTSVMTSSGPFERIQFMTLGRDPSFMEELLDEARDLATAQEEGKTIVFTNWGKEWRPFGSPRARRSISSVILDRGCAERLVADVEDWRRSREWYTSRGIYIFHTSVCSLPCDRYSI